jgi:hypothetical protein
VEGSGIWTLDPLVFRKSNNKFSKSQRIGQRTSPEKPSSLPILSSDSLAGAYELFKSLGTTRGYLNSARLFKILEPHVL